MQYASGVLARGGLVVFPTGCIYGLGADAFNRAALRRVFAVKGRSESNPLLVLIPAPEFVGRLAAEVPPAAALLMERFWPGRITLVLKAAADIPPELTAGTGKIGIRLPRHPVAAGLVRVFGRPVTGTSANRSGQSGCSRIEALDRRFLQQIDLVLNAGALSGGIGSSVVDVTSTPARVLREGTVPADRVRAVLAESM